jgi:CRP-like cAMP-binding protein
MKCWYFPPVVYTAPAEEDRGTMVTVSQAERASVAGSLLRQFWFFEGLAASDRSLLARVASFRSIERGEVVIDYGSNVHDLYCVLGGMFKLLIRTERRRERIFELVGTGQTFGEGLLFLDRPSPGRVVAIDDGRLLLVPGRLLITMLGNSPDLAMRWLRRVSQRIGHLLAELQADTGQSAGQRIVHWLSGQLGRQSGEARIHLDVTKATLAASLNTTPETFSRVLKHLRQEGIVRVEGREIVVLDPVRLRYLEPCVFCSKPNAEESIEVQDTSLDWEGLVGSRPDCEVAHWFGHCDCDVPHWCGGTGQLTREALAPRVPAVSAGQVPTDDADPDNG